MTILVLALAAGSSPAGDKVEGRALLGRVSIDKQEATVTLQDPTPGKDRYIVTIEVTRPRSSPKIKTARLQVWMLRNNFTSLRPCLVAEDGLEDEFLPQHDGDKGTVARGVISFDAEGHTRNQLAAVVVAVDGEPVAFKLTQPKK
jgi:hypothetical protein